MGACYSNNQQLLNEINKPENRKFILEHLNITSEDLLLSHQQLTTTATTNNHEQANQMTSANNQMQSTTTSATLAPANISNQNASSNCCSSCNCNCHHYHHHHACSCSSANNLNQASHNDANANTIASSKLNSLLNDKSIYNSLVLKIIAFENNNNNSSSNANDTLNINNVNECIMKLKNNKSKICFLLNAAETSSLSATTIDNDNEQEQEGAASSTANVTASTSASSRSNNKPSQHFIANLIKSINIAQGDEHQNLENEFIQQQVPVAIGATGAAAPLLTKRHDHLVPNYIKEKSKSKIKISNNSNQNVGINHTSNLMDASSNFQYNPVSLIPQQNPKSHHHHRHHGNSYSQLQQQQQQITKDSKASVSSSNKKKNRGSNNYVTSNTEHSYLLSNQDYFVDMNQLQIQEQPYVHRQSLSTRLVNVNKKSGKNFEVLNAQHKKSSSLSRHEKLLKQQQQQQHQQKKQQQQYVQHPYDLYDSNSFYFNTGDSNDYRLMQQEMASGQRQPYSNDSNNEEYNLNNIDDSFLTYDDNFNDYNDTNILDDMNEASKIRIKSFKTRQDVYANGEDETQELDHLDLDNDLDMYNEYDDDANSKCLINQNEISDYEDLCVNSYNEVLSKHSLSNLKNNNVVAHKNQPPLIINNRNFNPKSVNQNQNRVVVVNDESNNYFYSNGSNYDNANSKNKIIMHNDSLRLVPLQNINAINQKKHLTTSASSLVANNQKEKAKSPLISKTKSSIVTDNNNNKVIIDVEYKPPPLQQHQQQTLSNRELCTKCLTPKQSSELIVSSTSSKKESICKEKPNLINTGKTKNRVHFSTLNKVSNFDLNSNKSDKYLRQNQQQISINKLHRDFNYVDDFYANNYNLNNNLNDIDIESFKSFNNCEEEDGIATAISYDHRDSIKDEDEDENKIGSIHIHFEKNDKFSNSNTNNNLNNDLSNTSITTTTTTTTKTTTTTDSQKLNEIIFIRRMSLNESNSNGNLNTILVINNNNENQINDDLELEIKKDHGGENSRKDKSDEVMKILDKDFVRINKLNSFYDNIVDEKFKEKLASEEECSVDDKELHYEDKENDEDSSSTAQQNNSSNQNLFKSTSMSSLNKNAENDSSTNLESPKKLVSSATVLNSNDATVSTTSGNIPNEKLLNSTNSIASNTLSMSNEKFSSSNRSSSNESLANKTTIDENESESEGECESDRQSQEANEDVSETDDEEQELSEAKLKEKKDEIIIENPSEKEDEENNVNKSDLLVNDKLKLVSIVESVGFFMFPSALYINVAVKQFLKENDVLAIFENSFSQMDEFDFLFVTEADVNLIKIQRYIPPCEEMIQKLINHLNEIKEFKVEDFQKRLGHLYFNIIFNEFSNEFKSVGSTMQKFFNNLNSFHESLINHDCFGPRFLYLNESYTGYTPSFKCEIEKLEETENECSINLALNIFTIQENVTGFLNNFYFGMIECCAKKIWNLEVKLEKLSNLDILFKPSLQPSSGKLNEDQVKKYIMGYRVKLLSQANENTTQEDKRASLSLASSFVSETNNSCKSSIVDNFISGSKLSDNTNDSYISVDVFKAAFPFTILIDRSLNIKQIGDGLIRHLGQSIKQGYGFNFLTYFDIVSPRLNEYTFESLLINNNMSFRLKMKSIDTLKVSQFKDMELKGSIVYIEESDCLIFIGSPVIQHLEELTGRGLYISDIPIHDATRDIILVGEQTKAQEGLKGRMEKLKQSIVKAHEDIEEEKHKNIELLNMIFPSDIARKLWGGEKVQARSVFNVTLLYSDIVGFTSICSTAQPIQIIEMLKNLYTDFDNYCGLLDIYKIETIGDAYVAAGGLHRPSPTHAQQMAWMSLLMMESASNNINHKGEQIRMRIGLHTGDVLAGIVGIKQPRYCLFGNNCTIANKFESMSEEKRIHVSPITKKLLDSTDGFDLEPRDPQFLPENIVTSDGLPLSSSEISWFLNSYKHKSLTSADSTLMQHVQAALKECHHIE